VDTPAPGEASAARFLFSNADEPQTPVGRAINGEFLADEERLLRLLESIEKWQREIAGLGLEIQTAAAATVHHTHDYDLRALVRRCRSEGYGWHTLGVRYSLGDALRDMLKPGMVLTLLGGLAHGRVRSPAELLFPWLRPLSLWWGNRFSSDVAL